MSGVFAAATHGLSVRYGRETALAGVDPYNFYIDRSSADNVLPVG